MPEYYSVNEAAEATGVSPATVRAMLRDGVIQGVAEGGRWFVSEETVGRLADLVEETEAAEEADDDLDDETEDDDLDDGEEPDEDSDVDEEED